MYPEDITTQGRGKKGKENLAAEESGNAPPSPLLPPSLPPLASTVDILMDAGQVCGKKAIKNR